MSTHSAIIAKLEDGKFHGIYCHFDGYLDGVGEVLNKHYQDAAKVRQLVELGDISSLGREIGEKHNFDDCPKGIVNAYGRDRGEKYEGISTKVADSWQELETQIGHNGYVYVFDGGWTVNGKPLSQAIKDGEKDED